MRRIGKIILSIFAIIIIALFCIGIISKDSIEIPKGYNGTYIDIDGVRIRYLQQGQGRDLLLIHGTPASLEEWNPIIGQLAKKYRVTVYDRPGQGFSSSPVTGYNLEYNARIARDLIKKLDLKDVIVVGHSYGGAIALWMAVEDYSHVKAYVVAGSTSYYPPSEKPGAMNIILRIPVLGRGIAVLLKNPGKGMIDKGIRKAFHPNEAFIPSGFCKQKEAIWLEPKVLVSTAKENAGYENDNRLMIPKYKQIKRKVFLVYGRDDKAPTVKSGMKLAEIIPGAVLTLLDKTGHMIQFVKPMELVTIINKADSVVY